jgi:hypothetical protein
MSMCENKLTYCDKFDMAPTTSNIQSLEAHRKYKIQKWFEYANLRTY